MILPEKLLEKVLYWGPLFVGFLSLIGGVWVLQSNNLRLAKLNQSVVVSDMKPSSQKNALKRQQPAPSTKRQEDLPAEKVIPLEQEPLVTLRQEKQPPVPPSTSPDETLQEGDKPLEQVLADIMRLRGGAAGSHGALVYGGTDKTGTHIVSIKREHLALQIGAQAGLHGFLGRSGQLLVSQKGRQTVLTQLSDEWAIHTGQLGVILQKVVQSGVEKSAMVPLRAMVKTIPAIWGTRPFACSPGSRWGPLLGKIIRLFI